MHPYLLRHGGLVISSYPFLYGLGVAVAGLVIVLLLKSRGCSVRRSANLFMVAAIAVVLGGQILYGVVRWSSVRTGISEFLSLSSGGQILYGSVLLTVPALWLFARLLRMQPGSVFDAAAVGAPLGLVFGRIGCLCGGCCHGAITDLPWAVTYPKVINLEGDMIGAPAFMLHLREGLIPVTAGQSLPVHPVQVYEAIAMLVVFLAIFQLWKTRRFMGRLAPTFILAYCLVRFVLEFVRVQEHVLWGLTLAQLLSIGIGVMMVIWLVLSRKTIVEGRRNEVVSGCTP